MRCLGASSRLKLNSPPGCPARGPVPIVKVIASSCQGVRLALMIEGQEGVTWDDWVALADTCERVGIEALFRSDHYGAVVGDGAAGSLDAWGTINALAARTSTLRLGTLVSPASFRHPS